MSTDSSEQQQQFLVSMSGNQRKIAAIPSTLSDTICGWVHNPAWSCLFGGKADINKTENITYSPYEKTLNVSNTVLKSKNMPDLLLY